MAYFWAIWLIETNIISTHHQCYLGTNEENPILETFFKGYEEQQAMMLLRSNEETYEMAEKAKSAMLAIFSLHV